MTIELKIRTQSTPNPQALKFIMNRDVKAEGKVSFTSPQSCHHVPLANAIFGLGGVVQVHLYENILTITQDGAMDWAILTPRIIEIIEEHSLVCNAMPPTITAGAIFLVCNARLLNITAEDIGKVSMMSPVTIVKMTKRIQSHSKVLQINSDA
jgi:hypothetical protein